MSRAPRQRRKYRMAIVAGFRTRVVRRKGVDGFVIRFSSACSGCKDERDPHAHSGAGCRECGYTGRRRRAEWMPLAPLRAVDEAMSAVMDALVDEGLR